MLTGQCTDNEARKEEIERAKQEQLEGSKKGTNTHKHELASDSESAVRLEPSMSSHNHPRLTTAHISSRVRKKATARPLNSCKKRAPLLRKRTSKRTWHLQLHRSRFESRAMQLLTTAEGRAEDNEALQMCPRERLGEEDQKP